MAMSEPVHANLNGKWCKRCEQFVWGEAGNWFCDCYGARMEMIDSGLYNAPADWIDCTWSVSECAKRAFKEQTGEEAESILFIPKGSTYWMVPSVFLLRPFEVRINEYRFPNGVSINFGSYGKIIYLAEDNNG
jgi:hypothetical protein